MAKKKEPVFQARLDPDAASAVRIVMESYDIRPTLQRVINTLVLKGATAWMIENKPKQKEEA